MAGPPNPFAALSAGQKDAATGSAGRGRGSTGRPTPYQPKNPNAPRDPNVRGRGRGRGALSTRGRGRGAISVGSTARKSNEGTAAAPAFDSPFAQLKQNKKPFTTLFGEQTAQTQSPFASGAKGTGSFGTQIDSSRDPRRRRSSVQSTNGGAEASVQMEDAPVSNNYNDRYEQLKLDRAKQRERAIKAGQMADPNQPTSLNQAITPVGTCTSMCPEFERVERIVQKMVDKSEKVFDPLTNQSQVKELKMLKRFRRSAAGYDEQLPSDIRTPSTLLQTTNYLIRYVIGGGEPLGIIHKFVWDRTRSIRNDFSVQQLTQEDHVRMAVTCLERIARFHIVSLHLLSSPDNEEPFDRHQEREQLNNTMLSLMYYYDDNRGRIAFPNEDEFRAYYIIFSILDQRPDLEARVQKWPAELRKSPRVQIALELFAAAGNTWEYQGTLDAKRPNAIAQGFYTRFFSLIDSPSVSYLMACVAEIYFNHMRQTAIRSIWKGYCRSPQSQQHKNEEWTIEELTAVLYFDDDDQTIKFLEEQDLELSENANGDLYLNWGSRPVDSVAFQPSSEHAFSETYVESKRAGRTLQAIVLGLNIKEAASLNMVDSDFLSQRTESFVAPAKSKFADDDALFVSDDDNEIQPPGTQVNVGAGTSIDSPTLASSFPNPFEGTSQKPYVDGGSAVQTNAFQQPSFTQPAEPTKTFSSLFAPNAAGPALTSSTPAPNPFQALSSPFTSKPETSQNSSIFATVSNAQQPSNPFSSLVPSSKPSETNKPASIFSTATSAQQPSSIFSSGLSLFSSTSQKNNATATVSETTPKFTFTSTSQATSSTSASPFSIIPTASDPKTDQPPATTSGKQSSSIFDSAKLSSSFGAPPNPIFSFQTQDSISKEEEAPQGAPKEPSNLAKDGSVEKRPSLFATNPSLTSKPNGSPSLLPSAGPTNVFSTPAFFEPKAATRSTAVTENTREDQAAAVTPQAPRPAVNFPPTTADAVSAIDDNMHRREMLETSAPKANAANLNASATAEPVVAQKPTKPPVTEDPAASEKAPIDPEAERRSRASPERQNRTAERRRQEALVTRKRALDAQQEKESPDTGAKAAKISKPEKPLPRKYSMAMSSIKPLPTLPILEEIKALTAPKPAAKEPAHTSQVDEDEILLSAARIAAESLRSGPKLFDNSPAYPDPLPSSFSPASSFSSSLGHSKSNSPFQTSVHGYDVALAPDTPLGLGRTMSRTEQRIRLTGGKGLAYKPLNFTPEKNRKAKDKK